MLPHKLRPGPIRTPRQIYEASNPGYENISCYRVLTAQMDPVEDLDSRVELGLA
jgi:hypothetical protein